MKKLNRREFIGTSATASLAFTIVPGHVLGGKGRIAPSDRLNIAYIGCGTQGIRELASLLDHPGVQVVSVCDPNKYSTDYVDWSPFDIRDTMREATGERNWGEGMKGIPGGRDVGQELVNKYYGRTREGNTFNGCTAYADFRELFEKESGLDAVKIMTPDHLHAAIAIASMKKGLHVVTHKPIANRISEARLTIETARKTGVSTHLLAWSARPDYERIKQWIDQGLIGNLKEIHNWSNRPVWQQWQSVPADQPSVPEGLRWDLWLGPVPDMPYHPNYTHAVFRGWYDFGGGSIADMGHYSLFPLFLTFGINTPALSAEAWATTTCGTKDNVAHSIHNDVAYPLSCIIRFKFGTQADLPPFDLFWYDGGMRPQVPELLYREGKSLDPEGIMFVGERGVIVGGFRGEDPVLYPASKLAIPGEPTPEAYGRNALDIWINAFRTKTQSPGSFLKAGPVTETILLGTVALRARKRIIYDPVQMKITNDEGSNKFLYREYRKGWEI